MSSPSQTPGPSPTQSPSQSRSNSVVNPPAQQQSSSGGLAQSPSPSPSPTRGGSSSRPPSHPPTPSASQPNSRAPSLAPSPHIQHVSRGSSQGPTPPPSKSPSQSGLKPISRNPSLVPNVPFLPMLSPSPANSASYIGPMRRIPSYIAPYIPRFMREGPFFHPPTSPLPQNSCFPCTFPCPPPPPPPPPNSFYFPLLPPPPHIPRLSCSYPTPPALFTPPSSLSYTLPVDVLVSQKPHVVPTMLPPTFYTPFSRFYTHPRPRRVIRRSGQSPLSTYDIGSTRTVHFFRGS
ncbi:vegetative cell wall protein gp1 [Echinops telfairi]|uniref:Vegetative cell wall protein gp1 n=1 Tax=Echinops telfairi TaxID=9371 RepID=A0AC55DVM4_ECHTE|nr:vegetative cell wall protein gp1 [Echinops telfairi]